MQNSIKSRKSDMSGPAKTCPGGQELTANQRKHFYFFKFFTCPFLLTNLLCFSILVGWQYWLVTLGPGWGPYGPLWAHTGPPGQVLAGPDMSDFRLLVQFCMFWVQN